MARKVKYKITPKRSELRWIEIERQKRVQKHLDKYYLELSNEIKEKLTMQVTIDNTVWTESELNKLESNIHRPTSELVKIFKKKFKPADIEKAKKHVREKQKDSRAIAESKVRMTMEEFRLIYESRNMTLTEFYEKFPKFCPSIAKATVKWYLNSVRYELKGTHTRMTTTFYDLLVKWAKEDNIEVPPRGSLSVHKQNFTKTQISKDSRGPKVEDTTPEIKVEEILEEPKPLGFDEPCMMPSAPDYSSIFGPNATLKFGLLIDNDIRVIGDSIAYVEGAEAVYKQLGFSRQIRRVKLLVESFE